MREAASFLLHTGRTNTMNAQLRDFFELLTTEDGLGYKVYNLLVKTFAQSGVAGVTSDLLVIIERVEATDGYFYLTEEDEEELRKTFSI
jgi:hypothetical protein